MAGRETLGIYREELGDQPSKETIEKWSSQTLPTSVNVDITDNCNLRCPHCPLPQQLITRMERKSKGITVTPFNMDTDVLLRAYGEILTWEQKPVIQVTANGEPTLHPRVTELLCFPAQNDLDVVFTNNGTRLNSSLVESLCLAGVKTINISLDAATEQTYGVVRPSASGINMFQLVINNIAEAVRIRNRIREKSGTITEIMINMIRRAETMSELEQFVALKSSLGVDKVVFRPLNSNAGLTGQETLGEVEYSEGVITRINQSPRWACQFPFQKMNLGVSWGGKLRVTWCPHGWDRSEFDIGYYPENGTLKSLWSCPEMQKIRSAHYNNFYDPSSPCAKCQDWYVVSRTQPSLVEIMKRQ